MDHKRDYYRDSNNGLKRLKIIMESLTRAGIKSIPVFGSSVDQALFGTIDALKQENTARHLLREIQRLNNASEEQTGEIKRLSDKLETLDPQVLASMVKMLHKQDPTDKEYQININKFQDLLSNQHIQNDVRRDVSNFKSNFIDFQSKINNAQNYINSSKYEKSLDLRNVVISIQKQTFHKRLLKTVSMYPYAFSLKDVLNEKPSLKMNFTVDFADLYNYSFVTGNPSSIFDTYIFSNSSKLPLFFLPGSLLELNHFLELRFNKLLNYNEFKRNLSDKINLSFGKDPHLNGFSRFDSLEIAMLSKISPFQCIRSLFEEERVIPIKETHMFEPDRLKIDQAHSLMNHFRPYSIKFLSNYFDAVNFVSLSKLNSNSPTLEEGEFFGHITSSHRTKNAGKEFMKNELRSPLANFIFCYPQEYAFRFYCEQQNWYTDDYSRLINELTELLCIFDFKKELLRTQLEVVEANSLLELANYYSNLGDVLLEGREKIINPFCDEIQKFDVNDFIDRIEFDEAYDLLIDDVSRLMEYLEPIRSSFEPFFNIVDESGSSGIG